MGCETMSNITLRIRPRLAVFRVLLALLLFGFLLLFLLLLLIVCKIQTIFESIKLKCDMCVQRFGGYQAFYRLSCHLNCCSSHLQRV